MCRSNRPNHLPRSRFYSRNPFLTSSHRSSFFHHRRRDPRLEYRQISCYYFRQYRISEWCPPENGSQHCFEAIDRYSNSVSDQVSSLSLLLADDSLSSSLQLPRIETRQAFSSHCSRFSSYSRPLFSTLAQLRLPRDPTIHSSHL